MPGNTSPSVIPKTFIFPSFKNDGYHSSLMAGIPWVFFFPSFKNDGYHSSLMAGIPWVFFLPVV
jgi:hypothetical protein